MPRAPPLDVEDERQVAEQRRSGDAARRDFEVVDTSLSISLAPWLARTGRPPRGAIAGSRSRPAWSSDEQAAAVGIHAATSRESSARTARPMDRGAVHRHAGESSNACQSVSIVRRRVDPAAPGSSCTSGIVVPDRDPDAPAPPDALPRRSARPDQPRAATPGAGGVGSRCHWSATRMLGFATNPWPPACSKPPELIHDPGRCRLAATLMIRSVERDACPGRSPGVRDQPREHRPAQQAHPPWRSPRRVYRLLHDHAAGPGHELHEVLFTSPIQPRRRAIRPTIRPRFDRGARPAMVARSSALFRWTTPDWAAIASTASRAA